MRSHQDRDNIGTPLRVGVVGLGIGRLHLDAFQKLPGVQIVGAADVDVARLEAMGATYQIPHLYHDYRELIAHEDVDAISICTPNALHAPIATAALRAGKHVLCEKPMARTAAEAASMVAAAREAGRVLDVVFNHRRRGEVEVLKRYIDEGTLGRIYYAKARWWRRNGIPGLGSWFTKQALAGGGPLIDLGVHILDMVLYLLGEPEVLSVNAATYAELGPRGIGDNGNFGQKMLVAPGYEVEDLASAFIRLTDGGTLVLETSWAVYRRAGDEFGVTLYGTEGGAEISVADYVGEDALRIYTDVAGVPSDITPHVGKGEGIWARSGTLSRRFAAAIGRSTSGRWGCTARRSSRRAIARPRSGARCAWMRCGENPAPRMEVKRDVVVCN